MRLLYLIPSEGFGGAERQAVYHIAHLPRMGIDVVLMVGPGRLIVEQLAREGVLDYEFSTAMVRESGRPVGPLSHAGHVAFTATNWVRGSSQIRRVARRHRVDAILGSRTAGTAMVGAAAHSLSIPQIWRAGSRPTRAVHRLAFRTYAALFRPAGILCNCRAVQRAIQPLVSVPCPVVYNGVDLRRFDPAVVRPDPRWDVIDRSETVTLGVSGRPAPGKGLETIADALARLDLPPRRLRVLIAGDYGWREHYERYFVERGLATQVSFIGHVAEVERFLRGCDIHVLASGPSSTEGLPNTVLEAMAMRCAVVTTDVGGVTEAVSDGESGLLVPPHEPRALAHAVQALVESQPLRAELGRRARETVERRFSLDATVVRLAEVVDGLLGASRVPTRRLGRPVGPPREVTASMSPSAHFGSGRC